MEDLIAKLATDLSVKLVVETLGPSFKGIGEYVARHSKAQWHNLQNVLEKMKIAMTHKAKVWPASEVPMRVVGAAMNDAAFCDDDLTQTYLAGVLASAKGPVSRDDRAMSYLALLRGMSTYQVRAHYIIYASIMADQSPAKQVHQRQFRDFFVTITISEADFQKAMDFGPNETPKSVAEHVFVGLNSSGLVQLGETTYKSPQEGGGEAQVRRFFHPTRLGIELFLWADGMGEEGISAYFDETAKDRLNPTLVLPIEFIGGNVSFNTLS